MPRMTAASILCLVAATLGAAAAAANAASPAPSADHPVLADIAGRVEASELHAVILRLVGFGTRQTASDTTSNTRGIGAARRWVEARFEKIGRDCGGCLIVDPVTTTVTGERLSRPTKIVDVLGIQRGTSDPNRVVVISGHLDSRVSDVMNATANAPGADDDGSGVAAVLEAARVLSGYRFPATIVYAVLSGEEQNLYGGTLLAATAKARGWRVEAQLNNDIVGNIHGQSGVIDNTHVRIFSEGTKSTETPAEAASRRYNGGEVDSPSRNLARYMAALATAGADEPARPHDLPDRPIPSRRRPGADARRGVPGGARHRSGGELHPPAPGRARRERDCLRRRHRRGRFSVSRASHPAQCDHLGESRVGAAAAGTGEDRRRRHSEHGRQLGERSGSGGLPGLVAGDDRAAVDVQPLGGGCGRVHARECQHRRLLFRSLVRLRRRVCEPYRVSGSGRRVLSARATSARSSIGGEHVIPVQT